MLVGAVLMALSGAVFLTERGGAAGLVLGSVVLGTGHLLSVVGQQAAVANTAGPGRFDTRVRLLHVRRVAGAGRRAGADHRCSAARGALPDTQPIFAHRHGARRASSSAAPAFLRMPAGDRAGGGAASGGMGTLLRLPGLLRALLISCVVLAAVDITLVYLPALGADRGLAAGFVGLLLTLRAVASMTSRFFLGRLVGLVGRRRLMIVSVALSAVSMAVVARPAAARRPWPSLVVLLGLGLGVGQPLTMSWLAEVAPAGLRGRAMSLRLTGNRLGQVLIPSAVGLVAAGRRRGRRARRRPPPRSAVGRGRRPRGWRSTARLRPEPERLSTAATMRATADRERSNASAPVMRCTTERRR